MGLLEQRYFCGRQGKGGLKRNGRAGFTPSRPQSGDGPGKPDPPWQGYCIDNISPHAKRLTAKSFPTVRQVPVPNLEQYAGNADPLYPAARTMTGKPGYGDGCQIDPNRLAIGPTIWQ